VLKLRARGRSYRAIATATGLGLRTIRTIVERQIGLCRVKLQRIAVDRQETRRLDAKKRAANALPRQVNAWLDEADEFVKDERPNAADYLGAGRLAVRL
jgi:hypothetical protein